MSSSPFIHLHLHSHYSIGDATAKIKAIYKKALEYKMHAVALTDHGNLFGAADFFTSAPAGVKPIIGCEIYVTPFSMHQKKAEEGESRYYHLVLLVKDKEGYKNLVKIVSAGYLEGFYYRPRVDFKTLENHSKGLIALSACMAGEIPKLILSQELEKAKQRSFYYRELFGNDSFFLEIQDNGLEQQKIINQAMLKISQETGIPLVATNDVHYMEKEDALAHDLFLCIPEGKKLSDPNRKRYGSNEFYFKSYEEMKKGLESVSLEAITNTKFIADMCFYAPELNQLHLPEYPLPEGKTPETYLRELCEQNLPKKIKEITPEVRERLDFELQTINKMGFPNYFLIVQDFIAYAEENGIIVGPGRGSAAGSLVAYLLGITKINPLPYHLLFERFLNPGRVSMPDIDTDFDDLGRDKVIEYVKKKYGEEYVAQIITFGTLGAKAAIKDVGRVLDIPLEEVLSITKMIPSKPGIELSHCIKEIPELKLKIESSEIYQKLWNYALKIEGLIRNSSVHAAGIVIGKEKLTNIVPLYRDTKTGAIIVQFEGEYLEKFGLLKMDFLGLINLRIMAQAIELIKKNHNKTIRLMDIPLDDPAVYKIFQEAKTLGVFQCESDGMRELMKKIAPTCIEDIIALIALYRPGPLNSGMADDFVKRKKDPSKIVYPHPELEEVLKDTYGVIVYQEQVMLISRIIAGFSQSESDDLRKAMGKKDKEKMAKMKEKFIQGAIEKKRSKEFAETLFEQMEKFAEYGFNKSHSTAYAYIAYQNAYLKAHYPLEYMTAILNAKKGGKIEDLRVYLKECADMGIPIYPPDINKSSMDFSIEENKGIRFGLSAIKNIGESNIVELLEERNKNGLFSSLSNLLSRVSLNKKVLENLTYAGALDSLIPNRATLFHNMDKLLQYNGLKKRERSSGMEDLFGMGENNNTETNELFLEKVPEWKENEILKMEKATLGLYVTGHPLARFEEKINAYTSHSAETLQRIKEAMDKEEEEGFETPENITIAGIISEIEIKKTKNGEEMAIGFLEDLTAEVRFVIFPKVYKTLSSFLSSPFVLEEPVYIKGITDFDNKEVQIRVDEIKLLKDMPDKIKLSVLNIKLDERNITENYIKNLQQIFHSFLGKNPVVFHLYDLERNQKVNIRVGTEFYVSIQDQLLEKLRKIACVQDIWINGSA